MNEYLFLADALTHDETIMVPGYDEEGNPIMEEKVIQVDNYPYHMATQVGMLDERFVVLALHEEDPLLPGDTIVTYREGDDVAAIANEEIYKQLRPFGNNPDGSATGVLLYPYLDGFPIRVFNNDAMYPPGEQPFDAECMHKHFDTPATPASTGWGFRFELIGSSYDRDPTNRAIGVYSDPECTAYLWTTGALQQGPSDWQTDEEGNPLDVWFTDSWNGDRPDAPKDWHIACLFGSAQEGHQTLAAGSQGIHYLFWERDQVGEGGEILPWVQLEGTNPYQIGDKVTHEGSTWESTAADNVWEPGVYRWAVIGGALIATAIQAIRVVSDDAYSTTPLRMVEKKLIREHLRGIGVSLSDIQQCGFLKNQVTPYQALLRLIECCQEGKIKFP